MFVCVCVFVCGFVTARPWVRRTYVCATAPSIWIFFPIFFILGGGRRDVFFDHSRPDTFTSQFVLWTSEWTCRDHCRLHLNTNTVPPELSALLIIDFPNYSAQHFSMTEKHGYVYRQVLLSGMQRIA